MNTLKIGILGVGSIGKTIALRLAAAGHSVEVANSTDPETISDDVLATGAKAEWAEKVVKDKDVLILSIPFFKIPALKPLIATVAKDTVLIDTSNYYPGKPGYYQGRDPEVEDLDNTIAESEWVQEQLDHPVVKAWNNILAETLLNKHQPEAHPERLAIAVAADRTRDLELAAELIELTGFDAFHTGSVADSWRQQPGAPAYCTDMKARDLPAALAAVERARLPARRDLVMAVIEERLSDGTSTLPAGYIASLNKAVY
jgi:predicted dinucleotide-binding enzyme